MPPPRLACNRGKAKRTQRHRACASARSAATSENSKHKACIPFPFSSTRPFAEPAHDRIDPSRCGIAIVRRLWPATRPATAVARNVGSSSRAGTRDAEAAGANARPGAWKSAAHACVNHQAILKFEFFIGVGLKSRVVLPPTLTTATGVSGCVPGGFRTFAGVKVHSLKRAKPAKAGDAKSTV